MSGPADSVRLMAVWVSLLRGINLGAHNKVNMPHLREALAAAGFADVRTYVQSGNVVARSRHRSSQRVAEAVRGVVLDRFGLEVPVIVRSPHQLRSVLAWCPFPDDAERRPTAVQIVHFAETPDAQSVRELLARDWFPDSIAVRGTEAVVRYADTMHASRLQHATVLKQLRVTGTARNWRTLQALVEMTGDA